MLNYNIIIFTMDNEIQFKIVKGKGSYGGNKTVKKIVQILSLSKDSNQCMELRILHCSELSILDGIQICKLLKNLNLSCNAIEHLSSLKSLLNLQVLDVKANRIKSLKGIENLLKLIKIDASQNKIESLDGLQDSNNQIQSLILYKNNLKNLDQLERLKTFKSLKEVCFQKGSSDRSNPFCQDKSEYFFFLKNNLMPSKDKLQKIDELSQQQIKYIFQKSQEQYMKKSSYDESSEMIQKPNNYAYSDEFQNRKYQNNNISSMNALTNQKLMLMTQRQADLERIIDLKGETIQQMKHKCSQLEMANTNQYRESIKKEVEFERVTGQISELSKAIDQKDYKINQLHKRIEELLKVNSTANNLADTRSQQLQKLRRDFGQQRIQNSELRALNKDQQTRLRQLQNKTLTNIEDKSQRIEQLRSKNENLMKQNYELQRQQQQYKDRIRQFTQLLKQWQSKYQQTVNELEAYHNNEKQQIFRQIDAKNNDLNHKFEDGQRSLNQQWQDKINGLQSEYSRALEETLQKYNQLKRAYDEKYSSEGELKVLLKTVMSKNTENENTIKEYQDAIIKSKKNIISLTSQYQSLAKEHYQLKGRLENQVRQLQNELSKTAFSRDKLERDIRELKATNQYLQKNFNNLNSRQKQFEQLLEKVQNLQTALDAKNVMLDDKNETIQSLKSEIEAFQKDQQDKVDLKEYEKLNQKYRRQKQLLKSLQEKNNALNEQKNELAQKCQMNNNIEQQFNDVNEIVRKQLNEIREKQQVNNELVYTLEKLKNYSQNLTEEVSLLKNQKNKLLHSLEDKQTKWTRILREKQNQNQRKLHSAQEQINKYKQITDQFKNFTKTLNF